LPSVTGQVPFGDLSAPPALSLRGWGLEVLIRPLSAGWMPEGDFPPLVTPVVVGHYAQWGGDGRGGLLRIGS